MRVLLVLAIIATLFYLLTGIVYLEGDFSGQLVLKPYPMRQIGFGGGEEGAWVRHHPGQPLPWFMQNDFRVIKWFSWEEGTPGWVTAYGVGYLALHLIWVVLAVAAVVRVVRHLATRRMAEEAVATRDDA